MKPPYTHNDIAKIAVTDMEFDPERILATYANEKNWDKIYDDKGAHWCWKGPVIVGFELAQWGAK